ncbi:MAG TPA: coproporphyrinogen III oxidase family protein, partial [Verrucomicrobiae bacterium]|nr:coproporphyrinogen III oxidase family protein [Verrucomicrobiae bacterium]
HSMLPAAESVRFATTDNYDEFFTGAKLKASLVSKEQALEESFFLGLRLNHGVDMGKLREEFGRRTVQFGDTIAELVADGLLQESGENLRLTARGRLLSNGVFERFIGAPQSTSSIQD